jgi:hypothetical protein
MSSRSLSIGAVRLGPGGGAPGPDRHVVTRKLLHPRQGVGPDSTRELRRREVLDDHSSSLAITDKSFAHCPAIRL